MNCKFLLLIFVLFLGKQDVFAQRDGFQAMLSYEYNLLAGDSVSFPLSHRLFVKNEKAATHIKLQNGDSVSYYVDGPRENVTFLMHDNIAVMTNDTFINDFRNIYAPYQLFTITAEEKEIQGIKCKKAYIRVTTDESLYEIYYADRVGPRFPYFFEEMYRVPGIILEMTVTRPLGLSYTVKAKVSEMLIPDYAVEIPKGFTLMTRAQFKKVPVKWLYQDDYMRAQKPYEIDYVDPNKR